MIIHSPLNTMFTLTFIHVRSRAIEYIQETTEPSKEAAKDQIHKLKSKQYYESIVPDNFIETVKFSLLFYGFAGKIILNNLFQQLFNEILVMLFLFISILS